MVKDSITPPPSCDINSQLNFSIPDNMINSVAKCNARFVTSNANGRQGDSGFAKSKQYWKPIFSLGLYIDKFYEQSSIQQGRHSRAYGDGVLIKTKSNKKIREERDVNVENIHQLFVNNSEISEILNCEMRSKEHLTPHRYAFEKADLNKKLDKLTENTLVEPEVDSEKISIEKNRLLTSKLADNLPMTQDTASLTSDYFKIKKNTCYCIRGYSQSSEIPTASQIEEELVKKPQCLPPLGPPPILRPPPPKQPALPCCPKKRDKKNKCSALDTQCFITSRQTTRFVGCHHTEDLKLATRRALAARCSKSILDKASKGYIF